MKREFQFSEGTSNKFWTITLSGSSHTVQFGRVGTAGQTQTKDFASADEARKSFDKLVQEKVKKGYVELSAAVGEEPPAQPAAAVPAPAAPAKPAKMKPAVEEPAEVLPTSAPALASQTPVFSSLAELPRTLGLALEDHYWVTYKPHTPLPKPPVRPFDQADCVARIHKMSSPNGWYFDRKWEKAKINLGMTYQEADFWLMAMGCTEDTTGQLAERMTGFSARESGLSFDEIVNRLAQITFLPRDEMTVLLYLLLEPEVFAKVLMGKLVLHNLPAADLVPGLRSFVLPYLSDTELAELGKNITVPTPDKFPTDFYATPEAGFFLGAMLGKHAEIEAVVASWEDKRYQVQGGWQDHYHKPQLLIFGLGSSTLVEHHLRRLKLNLYKTDYLRAWLAHTEYRALDVVKDIIAGWANKDEAQKGMEIFTKVVAPEAAPCMVELMKTSRVPGMAKAWLDAHPEHTIAGLLPLLAEKSKFTDTAIEILRSLKRKGYEPFMRSCLNVVSPEAAAKAVQLVLDFAEKEYVPFNETTTPEWLKEALPPLKEFKKNRKPVWISLSDLPALTVDDFRLNEAQVEQLVTVLQNVSLETLKNKTSAPKGDGTLWVLSKNFREHFSPFVLDAFAWKLFEEWMASGASSKEAWAFLALGLLGTDPTALKLAALVRVWPGESQHQRAVSGLECLRAMGTDTALMQINGIAQKVAFKAIKARAQECMEEIASERNMSRAELEDRIVPDCGLDERGTRVFDFGARQFRFALGKEMKPMVRDEEGVFKPDLPKPNSKDTAEKAKIALEEWKLLKKQVAETAKIQAPRLEQAMVTERRWTVSEFEMLLVKHPLMTNLARLLVWSGYDKAGNLVKTFRVTEDQTYSNQTDDDTNLDGICTIGLAHPLHLSKEVLSTWGELLADYEIVPPFPQLTRPVFTLEESEATATDITRFAAVPLPAGTVMHGFVKLGWERGSGDDHGVVSEHVKHFVSARITAVVEFYGVPLGYSEGWEDQKLERCFFVPGLYKPRAYPEHKNKLKLGEIDPLAISEVLFDLTTVVGSRK
ncbi:MAG: DUF4132 domain-containing protein [Blastocatellia bacterium]|nr:DUF4132 domain-containing protein [Blastocatellia bacterium]